MTERLPQRVVCHGRFSPDARRGGVETFARTLAHIFSEVTYTTTDTADYGRLVREGALVICDNQTVLDWPAGYPLIGFQHGFAPEKFALARTKTDAVLAWRQLRAVRRPATVWVACAKWISDAFARLQPRGGRAAPRHVIHHFVDVDRFDGRREGEGSRLVLHDARTEHKGKRVIEAVARALPAWRFEPLDCAPADVPDRMRKAAAFVHLSRYEGNSIVCNEAMAMNLPCLFTDVGLMRDVAAGVVSADVEVVPSRVAFGPRPGIVAVVRRFLESLGARRYEPRAFVLAHATPDVARAKWRAAMADLAALFAGGRAGAGVVAS